MNGRMRVGIGRLSLGSVDSATGQAAPCPQHFASRKADSAPQCALLCKDQVIRDGTAESGI